MRKLPTALLLALALLPAALGCSDEKPQGSGDSKPAKTTKAAADAPRYEVRGAFKGMDGELAAIHHETIPDFKNREGDKVGMMAMQMSFRVADGVDVASLKPEDPISFEFVVDWDQNPAIEIVSLEKLPADTELEL